MNTRKTESGKWAYDFTFSGKRYVRVIGWSKEQAEAAGVRKYNDLINEKHGLKSPLEDVKLEELAEKYFKMHSSKKRSWRRDRISIDNLKAHFRGLMLSEISPLRIEEYKAKRLKKVKGATINRELAKLKHIYTMAIKWRHAAANPVKDVEMEEESEPRAYILSADEEARLIAAASPHLRPIIIIALNTGLRRNEILSLKWKSVDKARGVIVVERELSKSKRRREIPMNERVIETFRDLIPARETVFFNNKTGKHIGDIKTGFNAACRRAKIKGLRFHDLRHTFATRLAEEGVDVATIKDLLGHSSIVITQRYFHPTSGRKQAAVELLGKKYDGGVRNPVRPDIRPENQDSPNHSYLYN